MEAAISEKDLDLPVWQRGMYVNSNEFIRPLDWRYAIEKWMYGISAGIGVFAFLYTVQRLLRTERKNLVLATRLLSYKISLTVADVLILFLYAPTQFLWITTFWWYGGDRMCKLFKFLSTFGFHLTANMQVLVAFDRLYITATMSTCRLSGQNREPYRTRWFLVAAWLFALSCSAPQLWIFGTARTADGQEQCVSVWLQTRMDHMDQMMYLRDYYRYLEAKETFPDKVNFLENGTERYPIPPPNFDEETIKEEARDFMYLEQIYNIVHLSTICVLPYLLELFCYTMILYILKGAQRGKFLSVSDVFRDKLSCLLSRARGRRLRRAEVRLVDGPTNPIPPSITPPPQDPGPELVQQSKYLGVLDKDTLTLQDGRCVFPGATPPRPPEPIKEEEVKVGRDEDGPLFIPKSEYEEIRNAKILEMEKVRKEKEMRSKSSACTDVEEYQPAPYRYKYKGWSKKRPLRGDVVVLPPHGAKKQQKSWKFFGKEIFYDPADTVPPRRFMKLDVHVPRIRIRNQGEEDPMQPIIAAPWIATVGYARRRARQKAFWMLSANLLLWGPYCIIGIINASTVFTGFTNFQFVAALVAFNAVSNIIL